MAKRFVDTEIWKHDWFHKLTVTQKVLWSFICDQCDSVGVWPINLSLASFYIGDTVTENDLNAIGLGKRIVRVADDKLWVTGFITFQYKTLNPNNKAQLGMMRSIVNSVGHLPLEGSSKDLIDEFKKTLGRGSIEGQQTLQDKDKEKVKDKEKRNKSTKQETQLKPQVDSLVEEWGRTLKFYQNPKDPRFDEILLARLVEAHGFEKARAALAGFRGETKNGDYDPAKFLGIQRLLDGDKKNSVDRLVNLGFAVLDREKTKGLKTVEQVAAEARV